VLCNHNPILDKRWHKYFFENKVFIFRNSQRAQSMSVTITNLIMFKETFSIYCENHTNQINALRGQNTEFLNVKAGGLYRVYSDENCPLGRDCMSSGR